MSRTLRSVLEDGFIMGLIGFAAVALTYALVNYSAGRSAFYTAALLGEAVFYGRSDAAGLLVSAGPVLAINGLYLAAFIALGTLLAGIIQAGERIPQFWYLLIFGVMLVVFHGWAALFSVPGAVRAAVPLGATIGASVVAVLAIAVYAFWRHPKLRQGALEFVESGRAA